MPSWDVVFYENTSSLTIVPPWSVKMTPNLMVAILGLDRASTSQTCHTWLPHANNASSGYNPLHQQTHSYCKSLIITWTFPIQIEHIWSIKVVLRILLLLFWELFYVSKFWFKECKEMRTSWNLFYWWEEHSLQILFL